MIALDLASGQQRRVAIRANLWTLWGYFLLRFYQYVRSLGIWKTLRGEFRQVVYNAFSGWHEAHAEGRELKTGIKIHRAISGWQVTFTEVVEARNVMDRYHKQETASTTVRAPLYKIATWYTKAFISVVFGHSTFSDYVIPYVLAVAAAVVSIASQLPPPGPELL